MDGVVEEGLLVGARVGVDEILEARCLWDIGEKEYNGNTCGIQRRLQGATWTQAKPIPPGPQGQQEKGRGWMPPLSRGSYSTGCQAGPSK